MRRPDFVTVQTPGHYGRPHRHPRCTGLGVAGGTRRRLGLRLARVLDVIEAEIAAARRGGRRPAHAFLDGPVVAARAAGRIGPQRFPRAVWRRARVTGCA